MQQVYDSMTNNNCFPENINITQKHEVVVVGKLALPHLIASRLSLNGRKNPD